MIDHDAPERSLAALVERAQTGDISASDALFAALYQELHKLARREVGRHGQNSPLGATTLLHEAYLAFGDKDAAAFPDRARFLAYAARAMRGVIIDRVRARGAEKRGGGMRMATLDTANAQDVENHEELVEVHDALEALAQLDPDLARVVDLRFFCGFTFAEIADVHGLSERTVQRRWEKARLMLRHLMHPDDSSTASES